MFSAEEASGYKKAIDDAIFAISKSNPGTPVISKDMAIKILGALLAKLYFAYPQVLKDELK